MVQNINMFRTAYIPSGNQGGRNKRAYTRHESKKGLRMKKYQRGLLQMK